MRVAHYLTVVAKCPVDQQTDVYEVVVRTNRLVKVEDILAAVTANTAEPVFQEELTKALHRDLACEVETSGWHGNVRTVVVC